jgi:hypothetical protein
MEFINNVKQDDNYLSGNEILLIVKDESRGKEEYRMLSFEDFSMGDAIYSSLQEMTGCNPKHSKLKCKIIVER